MTQPEEEVRWEGVRQVRRAKPVRRPRAPLLILSVLGLAGIGALFFTRPTERGEPFEGVPRELSGRWVTSDPRYADRVLVVERDRVDLVLEMGPEGRERYPIREVRGWAEGSGRGYLILYGREEEYRVEVFVAEDGTMRLKNPSDVAWRRIPFSIR